MKEWTREDRYTKIEDVPEEELLRLKEKTDVSNYRQSFHIQPVTGLLNDPNGFSFYNGKWHLFYQWFPLGAVHGLKYWYHVTSTDLVNWENEGIGIRPNNEFDSHGAYSGSGIVHNNKLHLMYTGNTRSEKWERTPFQLMAIMKKTGEITKIPQPLIKGSPEGYTDHFRDPKVWKHGDYFYCIIGAQRKNLTGTAIIYQSRDLQNWMFKGEINTQLPQFGYMWECPDLFTLDNQTILLFSPQGIMEKGDRYQNIYQTGFIMGKELNYKTLEFEHNDFQELDFGFDFYAAQTTSAPDGRRILVGWMGLPEISYPTDKEEWAHCLTIPRELSIEEGKLKQRPIREIKKLRKNSSNKSGKLFNEVVSLGEDMGRAFEMKVSLKGTESNKYGIKLFSDGSSQEGLVIEIDKMENKFRINRDNCGHSFASEYGTVRQMDYAQSTINLRIFVDYSSIEIFVNDGDAVFTSRIFPKDRKNEIQLFSENGLLEYEIEGWTY